MKHHQLRGLLALCLLTAAHAPAAVRYVDVNSTNPTPPYLTWVTAATNIQDAVDAALAGDQILVTNGVYQTGGKAVFGTTNRVMLDKPVVLQSVNGPQATLIDGGGSVRCVRLANGSALTGFTLTNGFAGTYVSGGGVAFGAFNSDAVVSNCVIVGCLAGYGGGVGGTDFTAGGYGPLGGTLNNCVLRNNSAVGPANFPAFPGGGGGAYGTTLNNCTLTGNTAAGGSGGGAASSRLRNCIAYYNSEPNHLNCSFTSSCTTTPADGPGNITNAPLFIDAATGNLRLQSNSPCINSGNNDYATSPVDLDSKERVVGGTVDMGAYEWIAVPTHYVSLTSPNPTPPYLSWSTAATNIQDALDAGVYGHRVLVTNGVYQKGARRMLSGELYGRGPERVLVPSWLRLESVNGPEVTSIVGYQVPETTNGVGAVRCVYLSGGASLVGFTLTNGATEGGGAGGGVYCEKRNGLAQGIVSNCVIIGNSAESSGGGSYNGRLDRCTLNRNSTVGYAPGYAPGEGGGAYGGTLNFCVLRENRSGEGGGAAGQPGGPTCTLNNCILEGNVASVFEGGGAADAILNNCILAGNRSRGYGGGAFRATLSHCTLVGNEGGASYSSLVNCIALNNYLRPGWELNCDTSCRLNYCCTRPLPDWPGNGNITMGPLFVDAANGNLRLQSNSPCINAGRNPYGLRGTDLDGNPRIAGGTVDMGAYEFQTPASVLSYAWLQQFNLPTDGSADYADADKDGMNNWQEWIAGTDPTDASSAFRLLSPSTNDLGLILSWESVTNRTYYLERATNLTIQPAYSHLGFIAGHAGTTGYTDTNATGPGPFFYRVGVQP